MIDVRKYNTDFQENITKHFTLQFKDNGYNAKLYTTKASWM